MQSPDTKSKTPVNGEKIFRVRFLDESGSVMLRFRMRAQESEAVGIAAVLHGACADVCPAAEVWQGHAPVAFMTPYGGRPTREELSTIAQQIVVEREILLRDSRTCIAESRRLLSELRAWTAGMPLRSGAQAAE